jgi:hypothetical protein
LLRVARSHRAETAQRSGSAASSRMDLHSRPRCSIRAADQPTRTPCVIVVAPGGDLTVRTPPRPAPLHPGDRQPHDGSLTPDPRRPLQSARRPELRHMPPNHSLIDIQPDAHRRYRHHPQPSDESPHPPRVLSVYRLWPVRHTSHFGPAVSTGKGPGRARRSPSTVRARPAGRTRPCAPRRCTRRC